MKPAFEAPYSTFEDTSIVTFERRETIFDWNWHYHPEMELTFIETGFGMRVVGDHTESYQAGDLVLLGPNLPHTWISSQESKSNVAIVIQFRSQAISEALANLPEFTGLAQLFAQAAHGIRFPPDGNIPRNDLRKLLGQQGAERWLNLVALLNQLANLSGNLLASPRYRHQRVHKLSSRLERVTTYIEQHCCEEISLGQVARIAGLTPTAFSRFFRKMTHKTFVNYRNGCRIREASRLLVETDLSITDVAYDCGFGTLANFHRRFQKEKRMTPLQYRKYYNCPDSKSDTRSAIHGKNGAGDEFCGGRA